MSSNGPLPRPNPGRSAPQTLTHDELARYGRHLVLPEFGVAGQSRLKAASAAIVGLGGLGCPVVQYLAAAGVGSLVLIDGDRVDRSNLQRQILYGDADVGDWKADVAARMVARLNPHVAIHVVRDRLDARNAMQVLGPCDVVVDASDNFPTRYLVNDAAGLLGIPSVHGSVLRFEGRVTVLQSGDGPCYRCLYPEPPPPGVVRDCQDAGVLGVLPGLVGVLQATEVIKLLSGVGTPLAGRLVIVDGLGGRFREFRLERDPDCRSCGRRASGALVEYVAHCEPSGSPVVSLAPSQAASRIAAGAQVVDVRDAWEWNVCRLPNAVHAPLARLDEAVPRLDPAREVVVYCHHGVRSADAARRLLAAGFGRVAHLEGGIDRWSLEVDPGVARY